MAAGEIARTSAAWSQVIFRAMARRITSRIFMVHPGAGGFARAAGLGLTLRSHRTSLHRRERERSGNWLTKMMKFLGCVAWQAMTEQTQRGVQQKVNKLTSFGADGIVSSIDVPGVRACAQRRRRSLPGCWPTGAKATRKHATR